MYYTLDAGAKLYRVTSPDTVWPTPLLGQGAYFTHGGRYNRAGQATVYCSEDPLVALTEAAFYQALEWQLRISTTQRFRTMTYPLVSDHILWCFTLDSSPPLIDLEHSQAQHTFQYPPRLIHNPSLNPRHGVQIVGQPPSRDYTGTQELADLIRAYLPPPGANPARPEGVKAPSVRMRRKYNFQPSQLALFLMDPRIQVPYENRTTLVDQWRLRLEFEQARPRQSVTNSTVEIGWTAPRFQLGPVGHPAVLACARRPRAIDYAVAPQWHLLEIRFA
jgi:hypothetical protein